MTIAQTLSAALSGLSARSREAAVASGNIANATTEGYARRDVDLAQRALGGVRVEGVRRAEDPRLSGELRGAEATRAGADLSRDALRRIERLIGSPEAPGSLAARLATLEGALTEAAADPGSEARLRAATGAIQDLARGLNAASEAVGAARTEAEAGIGADVRALNEGLGRIAALNQQIAKGRAIGRDVNAVEDMRRAEIDAVARIAPVRAFERQDGMITLIAEGGATLLESIRPAEIGFEPAGLVTPDMTVADGGLGVVTLRGKPVDPAALGGRLSGGTLGARLALRDAGLPEIQARLDGVAGDLAARLGPDVATASGVGPGLLTDGGGAVAPVPYPDLVGLAGRLRANPAALADPTRLRDGLDAAAPGPAGRSDRLRALSAALAEPLAAPAGFLSGRRNASELLAEAASGVASARLAAEEGGARAGATAEVLRQEERAAGVDTDAELQRLLAIERGYAAGARVLKAADDMLARLLEI